MAEKLTEKINRIIKQSDIEDAKLKKLYVDVFTAMSEYQENLSQDFQSSLRNVFYNIYHRPYFLYFRIQLSLVLQRYIYFYLSQYDFLVQT